MVIGADRRRVVRLTLPGRWRDGDLHLHLVHLLDLSALGARIAHGKLLHVGGIGYVDLLPTFGAGKLRGRVVWTRLRGTEQTREGGRRVVYESGLEFIDLSPEQQAVLATALATLQAVQTQPNPEPSP